MVDGACDLASEKYVKSDIKNIQNVVSLIETVFVVYIFNVKL